jgi:hypothetical protein
LLKTDKPPPDIEGVKLAKKSPKVGDHLYALGFGPRTGKLECQGGVVYGFSHIPNMGHIKPSIEFIGTGRNGDSGGPVFNSQGELAGMLWGTGWNPKYNSMSISSVDYKAMCGFFSRRCGVWGRRYANFGTPVVMVPSRPQVPVPAPYSPPTQPEEPIKPGPVPVPVPDADDDDDELVPLPSNGKSTVTINELDLEINLAVDAEFYNKIANALTNIEQGKPAGDGPNPPDPPDNGDSDPQDDPCKELRLRIAILARLIQENQGQGGEDPRVTAIANNIVQIEQKLEGMQGSGEKDPRIDQLVRDVAELKEKLAGIEPGSGADPRVDQLLVDMAELKRRMTAIEAKPTKDPRVDAIANNIVNIEQKLAELAEKPCRDPRVDQILGRLDSIEARLTGLENDPAIQNLIQEIRILEKRLVDLQVKLDNLQDDTAQPGQDPDFQVIYLTALEHPQCERTDKQVWQMKEDGYDYLRVVVLNPHEASVTDVPRLLIFPGKEVVRGESNVMVRLSQLVR